MSNEFPLTYWWFHFSCLLARTSLLINVFLVLSVCTSLMFPTLYWITSCLTPVAAVISGSVIFLNLDSVCLALGGLWTHLQIPIPRLLQFTHVSSKVASLFMIPRHRWQWMNLALTVSHNQGKPLLSLCFYCWFLLNFAHLQEYRCWDLEVSREGVCVNLSKPRCADLQSPSALLFLSLELDAQLSARGPLPRQSLIWTIWGAVMGE